MPAGPGVVVITGIMAAGKSTVAQLLAERLPRAAHVRGDVFRRMIVSGRVEPVPSEDPDAPEAAEATAQLWTRYRLSAMVADGYAGAGFTAIVQDVILGRDLADYVDLLAARPRNVVVLTPSREVVAAREQGPPALLLSALRMIATSAGSFRSKLRRTRVGPAPRTCASTPTGSRR